jgi:multisubunit Na+/H+ antiporter MnhC subunit
MTVIAYLHTAWRARLAALRRYGDRGDSPVPTAVIIFGLVAVAMAVTALALSVAQDWMDQIPGPTDPGAGDGAE